MRYLISSKARFYELTKQAGKKQYLVPYLMSSHPGSTLKDAVILAEYLHKNRMKPEQVQDFYPTPGTVSTCMFYTELDPYTLKPVFVEKTAEGKAMQRALLQYYEPKKCCRVVKALKLTHRGRSDSAAGAGRGQAGPRKTAAAAHGGNAAPAAGAHSRPGKSRTARRPPVQDKGNDRTEKWQDRSRNTTKAEEQKTLKTIRNLIGGILTALVLISIFWPAMDTGVDLPFGTPEDWLNGVLNQTDLAPASGIALPESGPFVCALDVGQGMRC